MSREGSSFESWLEKAQIRRERLQDGQLAVLEAVFRFLEHGGHDYASRRLAEHFLMHAGLHLKVAEVARLVGMNRSTCSRHRPCSSSQVVQSIHHRQAGKFPGKLLPRYAGPVAQFRLEHPQATREEVLDFLERRWQIRPGYRALDNFLRKYGLHGDHGDEQELCASPDQAPTPPPPTDLRVVTPSSAYQISRPSAPFFSPARSTPARSSCCRPR